ncbi:MAG: cytochrome c oxidase assembly protein [Sulfuricella sp.]|nr:cytochrome c oxidase assembly protein [Sulfuricella sp.]
MKPPHNLPAANRRLALKLGAGAVAMFGFGYALVPFYEVFCRVTGLNGKSASADSQALNGDVDTRWVTVEFNGDVMPGLPWRFTPRQSRMRVHPGAPTTAWFRATNVADRVLEGRAVPSISPPPAARHFKKIECFCFSRQRLQAGEARDMPVTFIVDRELPAEIGVLTLSYAVFPSEAAAGARGEQP